MSSSELTSLSILESHKKLKNKEISCVELTKAYLDRIDKMNDDLNAFVHINPEYALQRAESIDKEHHYKTPLTGIPCGIKDVFCSNETPTTASSHILKGFVSPYESTTVKRLKDAGVVVLGKTNTDEFTMGSSTESSHYGVSRNPWDLSRVAGGSSGGSTSCVASDLAGFAMGTDTGGSIRQPSSFCGTVGLKVTYGRTSRFGVLSMTSSLDTIGPIAKCVEDAAVILQYIAGRDPKDSTTPDVKVDDYPAHLTTDLKGMRVGIPKEFFIKGIDADVEKACLDAIEHLKTLGAEIVEVSLPHTKYSLAVYYSIVPIEVSSNMARYDGIRYGLKNDSADDILDHYLKLRSSGFGKEVKRRILIGTYIHSLGYDGAYYIRGQKARAILQREFSEVMQNVDILAAPITPTTAFKVGEKEHDPIKMYLNDVFSAYANLLGIPGISVPCGFSSENLPIGIQFLGEQFHEKDVLKVAYAYEQSTEWHKRKAENETRIQLK